MRIRALVGALSVLCVLCFVLGSAGHANPLNRNHAGTGMSTVSIASITSVVRIQYRIFTTSTTAGLQQFNERDRFSLIVEGILLRNGDTLSFSFLGNDNTGNPCDVGDPLLAGTPPDGLTLVDNRASGPIGTAPNTFLIGRLRFNPSRNRLTFMCTRGIAENNPNISPFGLAMNDVPSGRFPGPLVITVHVDRPGVGVRNFDFPVFTRIRHTANRLGVQHFNATKQRRDSRQGVDINNPPHPSPPF